MKFHISFALLSTTFLALVDASRYSGRLASIEIREKLSLYALAIDQKDFCLLSNVFTTNAVANYGLPPPNDIIQGLPAIQALLKTQLGKIVTQHTISTTVVDFVNHRSPNSTAYLVANYFGQGKLTGQILSFYGKYLDQWENMEGGWKIKERQLVLFVS